MRKKKNLLTNEQGLNLQWRPRNQHSVSSSMMMVMMMNHHMHWGWRLSRPRGSAPTVTQSRGAFGRVPAVVVCANVKLRSVKSIFRECSFKLHTLAPERWFVLSPSERFSFSFSVLSTSALIHIVSVECSDLNRCKWSIWCVYEILTCSEVGLTDHKWFLNPSLMSAHLNAHRPRSQARPPSVIAIVIGEVITPFPQEICPGFLSTHQRPPHFPSGGAANNVVPLGTSHQTVWVPWGSASRRADGRRRGNSTGTELHAGVTLGENNWITLSSVCNSACLDVLSRMIQARTTTNWTPKSEITTYRVFQLFLFIFQPLSSCGACATTSRTHTSLFSQWKRLVRTWYGGRSCSSPLFERDLAQTNI